jgi:DNA-binding transcriptional LysR family regulator
MLDRITGLQVFTRATALGSLSAAGRALGMSQTMATKHLDALEHRLGVRLLHRTTRALALTENGRRYLESAERILAEWDEAEAVVSAERLEVSGTLRVNAPLSFGFREIAPLMPAFAGQHPLLTVDLGLNDRIVDLVEEGWDVAVRIGKLGDPGLVARRIAPCSLSLCASPAYLARRGVPRHVADLAGHDCLVYTLSQSLGTGAWPFGEDGKVSVPITGRLRASNGDALVSAAIGGMGIVYEPTFLVADALRAGSLVAITLDHPPKQLDGVFAVHPGSRRAPAKVRAFIDFMVAHCGPSPPWERDLPEAPDPALQDTTPGGAIP